MANVIVTFRVMPTSVDVDLDKLESDIKNEIDPERIEREPIAFGLVALNVTKIVEDKEGNVDSIENKLSTIKNVGQVEVTDITRSL